MTEVRRVAWPAYETPEWSAKNFHQGIVGTLELFHRSTLSFQKLAGEATGHPVAVFQRVDQAGYKLLIDERILADTDTLMVFGLDHLPAEQEAASEEIAAIREWLKRDTTCLLLAPHHDVGFTSDMERRWSLLAGKSRAALHAKSIVFDRKSVFIGSFNLDPRSSTLNTEVGVMIDSPEIASQVAKIMDAGVSPGSAYHVTLDKDDNLVWTAENNGEKVQYDKDPGTNVWERLLIDFIGILPIDHLL